MANKDPRVDKIIREAAPFAKPVLIHLRKLVHTHCPKAVETLKWRMPTFMYNGKILCAMAPFKAHCAFVFWQGRNLEWSHRPKGSGGMGDFGKITSLKDLPPDRELGSYIKQAMELNEAGPAAHRRSARQEKPPVVAPAYFLKALRSNKKALATYENFSSSCKRDYVEWITDAKTEETRERRLETAVDWMSEGRKRNWKYERC